jgi:hypothetical protein
VVDRKHQHVAAAREPHEPRLDHHVGCEVEPLREERLRRGVSGIARRRLLDRELERSSARHLEQPPAMRDERHTERRVPLDGGRDRMLQPRDVDLPHKRVRQRNDL